MSGRVQETCAIEAVVAHQWIRLWFAAQQEQLRIIDGLDGIIGKPSSLSFCGQEYNIKLPETQESAATKPS